MASGALFELEDYLQFVLKFNKYIQLTIKMDKKQTELKKFPVGYLESKNLKRVTIYFLHYKCFDEAKEKWETRKMN